jgi:hypothetical protein
MKHYVMKNVKYGIAISALIAAVGLVDSIPWWSFTIPLFCLGAWATYKKAAIAFFTTGFITGFITWAGSYLFFHCSFHGNILTRNGDFPLALVLAVCGLVGGITAGLAFYAGHSLLLQSDEKWEV